MTDETQQGNQIIISGSVEIDKENDPRWSGLTYEKDRHGRIWTYDENGKLICGAKTRSGSPCRKSPVSGRNRCRLHGGKSLTGIQHPNAKSLRYSRSMVDRRMLNEYETAFHHPDLMSLKDNIAMTDVRIGELTSALKVGESHKAWLAVRTAYDNFIEAHNKGDSVGAVQHLQEMGRLIKFGLDQYHKWGELKEMQDHRRRLTETEHKMQTDLKQTMTHDQAMGLLAYAVSAVRRRIVQFFPNKQGEECMAAISQDISAKLYSDPKVARTEDDF